MSATQKSRHLLATVVALVVFCAVTATAQASCGDYLHTRMSRPDSKSVATAEAADSVHADSESNAAAKSNVPQRTPCRGPECRQQRPHFPAAPTSERITVSTDAACAQLRQRLQIAGTQSPVDIQDGKTCCGHPLQIDRPPQAINLPC